MDFANGAYGIVIGGIGTFGTVKHSDNKIQCGKEWHNPGWTKPENKNEAYKQYKKARTLRAKNKFDDAQRHYRRALELCARFSPGYGKTAVQIRKEMSEMANERKNSQATK
ncbi:MAG: hypothetical protein JST44_24565 [Cyanobacteria bacterium SZAS LIN-5]|nr:hypothetical protein [Cyanobacteria bacterium SZAS LIN-5]